MTDPMTKYLEDSKNYSSRLTELLNLLGLCKNCLVTVRSQLHHCDDWIQQDVDEMIGRIREALK